MGLVDTDIFIDNLKQIIIDRDGNPDYLEELGLLENTPVKKLDTPIDTLCQYLLQQLAIGKFVLGLITNLRAILRFKAIRTGVFFSDFRDDFTLEKKFYRSRNSF